MKYILTEDQLRIIREMSSPQVKVGVAMKTTGPEGDLYESFFKEFDSEDDLKDWVDSINEGGGDKKIIGFGGSEVAIEAVKSGAWFGDLFGAPFTEGELAMQAMIAALRDGTVSGGINPLGNFPNGGLVTADNVADFTPQWAG